MMLIVKQRPQSGLHHLKRSVEIARPIEEVFAFFADAHNLEQLTPPFLRFKVLTPAPILMRAGTIIDYRLRIHHLPIRWQSEIVVWEPPHRFVDLQRVGPYRWWHHTHRFETTSTGTRVIDEVEYAVPGGRLVHSLFVRKDVERIFAFREETLRSFFNSG